MQEEILDFWFGPIRDGFTTTSREKLWYQSSPETDAAIRERFGALAEQALAGTLDWAATPRGRLALVILLDQLPRNVYRRTARAFAGDPQALALCREGIGNGDDQTYALAERHMFYHPLQHAEDLEAQRLSVAKVQDLLALAPEDRRKEVEVWLHFARVHLELIERFGRFPHRNAVLGRESTAEETASLQDSGRRFGQ